MDDRGIEHSNPLGMRPGLGFDDRRSGSERWSAVLSSPFDPRVYHITAAVVDLEEYLNHDSWQLVYGALRTLKNLFPQSIGGKYSKFDCIAVEDAWLGTTLELLLDSVAKVWADFGFDQVPDPDREKMTESEYRFALVEWPWPALEVPDSFRRRISRIRKALTAC